MQTKTEQELRSARFLSQHFIIGKHRLLSDDLSAVKATDKYQQLSICKVSWQGNPFKSSYYTAICFAEIKWRFFWVRLDQVWTVLRMRNTIESTSRDQFLGWYQWQNIRKLQTNDRDGRNLSPKSQVRVCDVYLWTLVSTTFRLGKKDSSFYAITGSGLGFPCIVRTNGSHRILIGLQALEQCRRKKFAVIKACKLQKNWSKTLPLDLPPN